jgi:hypothetical protein
MCCFDVHDRLEAAQFVEERQNLVHDDLLAKSDVVIIAVSDQSLNVVRHDFASSSVMSCIASLAMVASLFQMAVQNVVSVFMYLYDTTRNVPLKLWIS